jgi:hypothetical protein
MVDITLNKLNRQIIIFLGLSIINIVFAAIALAFGIVFVIKNLYPMIQSGMIEALSVGYIIAGGCLALVGFWWILPSVSIMEFITDLQMESDKKKETSDDEKMIGLIIQLLSYYREHHVKIKRMILISRLGGSFFLINGIISSIDLISKIDTSFSPVSYSMQIAAIIMMFAWGVVSFIIPHFLKQIERVWEYRVNKSKDAEDILRNHMETN